MTNLTFDFGYAMFQSDSALFGRPQATPTLVRSVGRLVASLQPNASAGFATRLGLALMPFSALAWMFIAR